MLEDYTIRVEYKEDQRKYFETFDKSRNFSLEERLIHLKEWLAEKQIKEYKIILKFAGFEFVQEERTPGKQPC